MATTGIQVHSIRYVTINAVKFTHITDWNFSINGENIDITSFDSAGWKAIANGTKTWAYSLSGHYAGDAAENGDEAGADLIAGTTVAFLSTTGVTGDSTFGGNSLLTSVEFSGALGSSVKVSISGEGDGALTIGVVA